MFERAQRSLPDWLVQSGDECAAILVLSWDGKRCNVHAVYNASIYFELTTAGDGEVLDVAAASLFALAEHVLHSKLLYEGELWLC